MPCNKIHCGYSTHWKKEFGQPRISNYSMIGDYCKRVITFTTCAPNGLPMEMYTHILARMNRHLRPTVSMPLPWRTCVNTWNRSCQVLGKLATLDVLKLLKISITRRFCGASPDTW